MKGFKNVNAYIYGKGFVKTDIAIENGKISAIGDNLSIDDAIAVNDNAIVVSGFIDEHIHGASGSDAMDKSVSAIGKIAKALAMEGTTSFLATTMTQSEENIIGALTSVNEYMNNDKVFMVDGARVLGVHLEGPFISEKHIGGQPLKYLADPDIEQFDKYNKASGNNIKLVTLAPEEIGADKLIKHSVSLNIVASAGHTDCGYLGMQQAIDNGLSCVTHCFNAQRGIHHREIGTAGTALLDDRLYTEAICDLIHLSKPTIKLIAKNKPKDKVILITDSIRAKWLNDGESELGGQKVIVKNGEARLADGTLAGSVLKMNLAIKNIVSCGVALEDAINYATINPARNLKIDDKFGSIAVGKFADFCVLDKEFNVLSTIREGNIIYKA